MLKLLVIAVLAALAGYVGYHVSRINKLRLVANDLVANTVAYQQFPNNPSHKILIVGDSLQMGVGASNPKVSMAGLIATAFPNSAIVNVSTSGDEISDAIHKVESLLNANFDFSVVHIGANDIFHLKNLQSSKSDLDTLLQLVKKRSSHVVFVTSGSVGYAPLFPLPADLFYTYRSKNFIREFITVAENNNVDIVNNYRARSKDIFETEPDTYYASDKFHLSDAGYQIWADRIIEYLHSTKTQ